MPIQDPRVFLAGIEVSINGPATSGNVTVEVNPQAAAQQVDDGDVELECFIVDATQTVIQASITPMVAAPNRGDSPARYHRASFDLSAGGLNLAAGTYTVVAQPSTSSWDLDAGGTVKVGDMSHVSQVVVLEVPAALVTRQWRG